MASRLQHGTNMFYLIDDTLKRVSRDDIKKTDKQYVAVLTNEEWKEHADSFDMGIDMDTDSTEIYGTKADVNYDSLTGTFSIPNRNDLSADYGEFAFALDEKGIVFIDDNGTVEELLRGIIQTKKWKMPSLERFIYDFLEQIIKEDQRLLEKYECELDGMEQAILAEDEAEDFPSGRLNEIRGDIRDLRIHYEQMMDLVQEFEENENNFFKQENIRYFRLSFNRLSRLHDTSTALRDFTMQLRDLYKAHLDIKQNRIMTVLTVVTTIFMPLTLIAGWYGMNFIYMPELASKLGYPIVIIASVLIVVVSLWFFKKKKWL